MPWAILFRPYGAALPILATTDFINELRRHDSKVAQTRLWVRGLWLKKCIPALFG